MIALEWLVDTQVLRHEKRMPKDHSGHARSELLSVGQACLHSYKERYRAMTVSGESHQEAVAGGLERGRPKGTGAGEEIGRGDKKGRGQNFIYMQLLLQSTDSAVRAISS